MFYDICRNNDVAWNGSASRRFLLRRLTVGWQLLAIAAIALNMLLALYAEYSPHERGGVDEILLRVVT